MSAPRDPGATAGYPSLDVPPSTHAQAGDEPAGAAFSGEPLGDFLAREGKLYVAKLRAKRAPKLSADPDGSLLGMPIRKPKQGKRKAPERMIQSAIVADIRRNASFCIVAASVSTAQGTGRTPDERARYGARLKAFGVWAGEPDLRVYLPGSQIVFLECKAPRGTLSDAQTAAHDQLRRLGHAVYVVRSVEDARAALAAHGVAFAGALRPALPAEGLRR